MVREYSWLRSRIDLGSFEKYAIQLLGEEPAAHLKKMVRAGSLTYGGLIEFRKHAMVVLGNYRTYGVAYGHIVRWLREADWALGCHEQTVSTSCHTFPARIGRGRPCGGVVGM